MRLPSMKKSLLAGLIAASSLVPPIAANAGGTPEKPNILLIVMDDLGTGQLDFVLDSLDVKELAQRPSPQRYQGDINKMVEAARAAMPNVSDMAAGGIKMTNAFVAHPVCGPSRAGIFTGRSPASFGTYSNNDAMLGIPQDIKLLPALFQENGYATASIGKWHNAKVLKKPKIAPEKQTRDYHDNMISTPEPGFAPHERGFDYAYSFYASGAALWNSPAMWRNGENVPAPGYTTHLLTDEAINFIDGHKDKPFFINLSYSVPHIPLEEASPAKYMDKFNTGNVEADKYFAALNAADEGIGKIINTLKENGELDNTLIFFISDNGAVHESPMPMNAMDKGFKGQMFNGGVRVPFVVYWPGHIPAGKHSDAMVSAIDILPTALQSAGITIPDSMKVEGKNIMPLLTGKTEKSPHDYLYWTGPGTKHYSEENQDFWHGYHEWITYQRKEIPNNPNLEKLSKGSWAIRDGEWALYFYDDGSNQLQLFNDKQNPAESNNLAAQYPEKVKELKSAYYQWIKDKPKPVVWGQDRYQVLIESAK